MIDVATRLEIARPVEVVFAFVADQTNAPRWQPELHEVKRLTDGPLGVGSEHEFVRTFAGRRVASRNRFVAYEPDRFVAFEIPSGWITGHASYRAEPTGSGGTVLTSRVQFHVHGAAAPFERLLGRLFARDSRRAEARLRQLLENGAGGGTGVAASPRDSGASSSANGDT